MCETIKAKTILKEIIYEAILGAIYGLIAGTAFVLIVKKT
jgi:hypothetical protein